MEKSVSISLIFFSFFPPTTYIFFFTPSPFIRVNFAEYTPLAVCFLRKLTSSNVMLLCYSTVEWETHPTPLILS